MKKKTLALLLAIVLVVGCAVGGTVAYLTQTTDSIVNTFTVGNIGITLTESNNLNLKLVPGQPITKNPKVTVAAGSEACWLFVKVEPSGNLLDYITYNIAGGWTQGNGDPGGIPSNVYYREISPSSDNQQFSVLADDIVTVKNVTKDDLDDFIPAEDTLTFTAYAVQRAGFGTAALAWVEVS